MAVAIALFGARDRESRAVAATVAARLMLDEMAASMQDPATGMLATFLDQTGLAVNSFERTIR